MGFADTYGYDPSAHPKNPNNVPLTDNLGKSYVTDPWGKKRYLTSVDDAKANGSDGLLSNKEFNADTGNWDTKINWGNIIGLGTAGVIGGSALAGAMGAGAGAGGASSAAAPSMAPLAGSAPAIGAGEIGVTSTAGLGGFVPTTATGISAAGSQGMDWGSILGMVKKGSDAYSGVSDVLGGAAKGANQQNNQQDQLKLLLANLQQKQNEDAATLPAKRLSTSVQGSIAAHATPSKFNWGGPGSVAHGGPMPSFSGGPTGAVANLDPETKQLGQTNVHDMLLQELQGGRGGGNTDMNAPQVGQTSGFDNALGGSALVTALLGALNKKKTTGAPTVPQVPSYGGGSDFGMGGEA